jgi:hypothetical protein
MTRLSPEERWDAQVRAMEPGIGQRGRHIQHTEGAKKLDLLLAYFDETEPAVADAIRYGLTVYEDLGEGECTYLVNYPEGHLKQ